MTVGNVVVKVTPQFIAEQSNPEEQQYIFAYRVNIENKTEQAIQVISRHWIITDGDGDVEEVRGLGVVGQQPLIPPGQGFEYTSGCPLTTPVGTMEGTYYCVDEQGIPFELPIERFVLSVPRTLH
ncbi:MAG TPA: Co2+/Mg2+ efflux protein ApaG [Paenalcaligenes sp.]|nr:Co2+/Mg2+ efflux protein ApaG [Paenalcaligenes sp.]